MTVLSSEGRISPPVLRVGPLQWVRTHLMGSFADAAVTIALACALVLVLERFLGWAVFNAVFTSPAGDASACRAVQGRGACWALIGEKHRFLLFATYPYEEHWRPALACLAMVSLYAVSAIRRFWRRSLLAVWIAGIAGVATLMWGGVAGLPYVSQERWGGLPITLMLATVGVVTALPLGILLALGRRAEDLPVIRALCVGYIELIRAVPLISLLFMASFLFPLFLPSALTVDKLLRAQVAFTMFSAAYLAEVVRGGLQGVPAGQYEAARALGLRYWSAQRLVILPQALASVVPALVNTFISMLKSTSLVLIIGLFDLLNAAKASIVDPMWQAFGLEMLIAVSLIYFVFCFAMSRYSQHLERWLGKGRRA